MSPNFNEGGSLLYCLLFYLLFFHWFAKGERAEMAFLFPTQKLWL